MTIKQVYNQIKNNFIKAGIDSPAFDAMCIIERIFKFNRQMLIAKGDALADNSLYEKCLELCNRRLNGEPLQYIIGYWTFMGCEFYVGEGVLIPRDDTEVVVNACINFLNQLICYFPKTNKNIIRILDLCSGSGAIAVSIAKHLSQISNNNIRFEITAIEKSDIAYTYLKKNMSANHVDVKAISGDIFVDHKDFKNGYFDLIVSNPPYIITQEILTLQREVQFEPKMALDGGKDGYDFYREIANNWSCKLKNGGMLALELGENQFETVKNLLLNNGFSNIKEYFDLGNIQRAISGTYNSK